jgi:hypothetical protein
VRDRAIEASTGKLDKGRENAASLSSLATPLINRANESNACAILSVADGGKLVRGNRASGYLSSSDELQSNPTSRVHAASWAVDILDPHEHLSDSVSKSANGCANASLNNPQKFAAQGDASGFHFHLHGNATRQLVHKQIHSRHPFF